MLVPLTLAILFGLFYIAGAQAVHSETPDLFELEGDAQANLTSAKLGTLASNINASVTSINVCQVNSASTTGVIIIDSEQMNLTGNVAGNFGGSCSGSKRTYTVVRGFNGPLDGFETAASHSGGADVTLITVPGAADGDDWENIWEGCQSPTDATPPATTLAANFGGCVFVNDKIGTDGDNTYFTGGGSKDREDISQWQFSVNDQSPDKNDIVNAFAASYSIAGTPTKRFLYFGADRYQVGGDAQMAFWFLKNAVCLAGSTLADGTPCPNTNPGKFVDPVTGNVAHHADGDILAVVNFDNGGTIGLAGVFRWDANLGEPVQVLFGGNADCTTITAGDDFCTVSNKSLLTFDPPWSGLYKGKLGGSDVNYYQTSAFIEGGIDLSAIPGAGTCFPGFLAETRSSSGPDTGLSLDAQLKDLAFGQFQSCDATIVTTPKLADGTTSVPAAGAQLGSATSGTDGQVQVKDSAQLTVDGIDTWSGTLKFFLCGPIANNATCSTGGLQIGSNIAVNQGTTVPVVSAAAILTKAANNTTGAPGRYCWRAEFDSTTSGVPDKADSSANECFYVKPVTPTLDTDAGNGPVTFGQPVTDTATLTGTAKQPATNGSNATYTSIFNVGDTPTQANAAGTITFSLYGPFTSGTPSSTECASTGLAPGFATANPSGIQRTVSGDGTYPTAAQATVQYTPQAPGWYIWKASYGGNDPNTLASGEHNTNCGDTDEAVQVQQIPTSLNTTQSVFPNDSATISASTGGDITGTLAFSLYNTLANCQAKGSTGRLYGPESFTLTDDNDDVSGADSEMRGTTNGNGADGSDESPTDYAESNGTVAVPVTRYWLVVFTPGSGSAFLGRQSVCAESTQTAFTNDSSGGTQP
jgi:hypothetical protein